MNWKSNSLQFFVQCHKLIRIWDRDDEEHVRWWALSWYVTNSITLFDQIKYSSEKKNLQEVDLMFELVHSHTLVVRRTRSFHVISISFLSHPSNRYSSVVYGNSRTCVTHFVMMWCWWMYALQSGIKAFFA